MTAPKNQLCVAVVGTGLVGGEFISQLLSLPRTPNPFRLIAIASSQCALLAPDPSTEGLSFSSTGWRSDLRRSTARPDLVDLKEKLGILAAKGHKTVFVDNTASDDVAQLYPAFLSAGVNVVTPNKKGFSGELALYDRILDASLQSGTRFLNESTVGAGLPIISTLKDLVATGDKILKIEGVFSGTMSYIFNEFSNGQPDGPSFSSVVAVAREKGYTEPHPKDDLDGADVGRKLTILSRIIPSLRDALPHGFSSVKIDSLVPKEYSLIPTAESYLARLADLDGQYNDLRKRAAHDGNVLRYVGVIDVGRSHIQASLQEYPKTHPFATSLGGADNIIMFHTERYGARPLIVQGAGAGAAVTAMGVLGDLMKML